MTSQVKPLKPTIMLRHICLQFSDDQLDVLRDAVETLHEMLLEFQSAENESCEDVKLKSAIEKPLDFDGCKSEITDLHDRLDDFLFRVS